MKTRVIEICKKRGISLGELAEKIGIKQANLSKSLNNNPTLNTLKTVADNLNVEITELFEDNKQEINGYLEAGGVIHKVTSVSDLLPLVGTFGIQSYSSYKVCKKDVKDFLKTCVNGKEKASSFAGILDGKMLFSISHISEEEDSLFMLSSYTADRKPMTICFAECEYYDLNEVVNIKDLVNTMWAEIVGCIDIERSYTDEEMEEREIF